MGAAADWISFWNNPNAIYVNQRHLDAHYRDIADGIVALMPRSGMRVLDYGSGRASHADRVAARAEMLFLCEAAATVRADLERQFGANPKIAVVAPDEVERMADRSLDLIVANSVVQYVSGVELDRLLALWRRLLAPGAALVVGDVLRPDVGPFTDMLALLRYAAGNGFFVAAIAGLGRTLVSDYRAVRNRLGVTTYGETEFTQKLAAAGYSAERLPRNLEHNQARMTFRGLPITPDSGLSTLPRGA